MVNISLEIKLDLEQLKMIARLSNAMNKDWGTQKSFTVDYDERYLLYTILREIISG